jgi:hypothetical protein
MTEQGWIDALPYIAVTLGAATVFFLAAIGVLVGYGFVIVRRLTGVADEIRSTYRGLLADVITTHERRDRLRSRVSLSSIATGFTKPPGTRRQQAVPESDSGTIKPEGDTEQDNFDELAATVAADREKMQRMAVAYHQSMNERRMVPSDGSTHSTGV